MRAGGSGSGPRRPPLRPPSRPGTSPEVAALEPHCMAAVAGPPSPLLARRQAEGPGAVPDPGELVGHVVEPRRDAVDQLPAPFHISRAYEAHGAVHRHGRPPGERRPDHTSA